MKKYWGKAALLVSLCVVSFGAAADTPALEGLTADDLLQLLVKEGVVSPEKLKELGDKIKSRERKQHDAAVEPVAEEQRDKKPDAPAGVVRVPYIPTYVRDEIRDEVRVGLKDDVTQDVLAQAKTERWGIPGATPEWVDRIKFSGDARLRYEGIFFGSKNVAYTYPKLMNVTDQIPVDNYTNFYNTTENQEEFLSRFRLSVNAKVTNQFEVGLRLATGQQNGPTSTQQVIGTYDSKYVTNFDLAYLSYTSPDKSVFLIGGRFINPFLSTQLVWDPTVNLDGFAGKWNFLRSDNSIDQEFQQFDPFVTVAALPLQEVDQSSHDKWMFGSQLGFNYAFQDQSRMSMALSYYDYINVTGKLNDPDGFDENYTAPGAMQKGNSVFNILNPSDPSSTAALYALAADYRLLDLTANYDYAGFGSTHVIGSFDYVKNIGYNRSQVDARVGSPVDSQTDGWQVKLAVGWPIVTKSNDWQLSLTYRYLERDAVLDVFADPDFHLGGTDAKGYILSFDYGLSENVWVSLKWMNSDEIKGNIAGFHTNFVGNNDIPLAVDTLMLDLNAKF